MYRWGFRCTSTSNLDSWDQICAFDISDPVQMRKRTFCQSIQSEIWCFYILVLTSNTKKLKTNLNDSRRKCIRNKPLRGMWWKCNRSPLRFTSQASITICTRKGFRSIIVDKTSSLEYLPRTAYIRFGRHWA